MWSRAQLLEKEAAHDMRELVTSAVTTQLKCARLASRPQRAAQVVAPRTRPTGDMRISCRRVECKLGQLDEVASHMQREREQLERMRHQIFADRFGADKWRLHVAHIFCTMVPSGIAYS